MPAQEQSGPVRWIMLWGFSGPTTSYSAEDPPQWGSSQPVSKKAASPHPHGFQSVTIKGGIKRAPQPRLEHCPVAAPASRGALLLPPGHFMGILIDLSFVCSFFSHRSLTSEGHRTGSLLLKGTQDIRTHKVGLHNGVLGVSAIIFEAQNGGLNNHKQIRTQLLFLMVDALTFFLKSTKNPVHMK